VKLQLPSSISTEYAYTITLVAELTRNRYDTTELMSLSVGNVVVVPNLDPFEDAFHSHRIEFTATAATLTLNFTNVSPAGVYARMHKRTWFFLLLSRMPSLVPIDYFFVCVCSFDGSHRSQLTP
jgi:hypothetical protein